VDADVDLPQLLAPKNGADDTTKRRQHFYQARTPRTLQGEVYVDAQTSAVLKARLDGRLGVQSEEANAELHLVVESARSGIGRPPLIELPKDFLPVHGEHRMLVKHSETAQSMGIPADHMVIINNGDIVEVNPAGIRIAGKVPSGVELVDASRVGVVGRDVLKERQQLAEDGVVTIAATVGSNGKLLADPTVQIRGVVQSISQERFQGQVKQIINQVLSNRGAELMVSNGKGKATLDLDALKVALDQDLRRLVRRAQPARVRARARDAGRGRHVAPGPAERLDPGAQGR